MNTKTKAVGWTALGLVAAVLLVEALSSWVSIQVIRAIEENER